MSTIKYSGREYTKEQMEELRAQMSDDYGVLVVRSVAPAPVAIYVGNLRFPANDHWTAFRLAVKELEGGR